ncbi:hypothetical protein SAMN02927900_05795 [Rhizobium mongolense subsp. loessense]|uniref:Nucleotidyltransferase-like protein n=1 Tax=Rhizobium mongolense subsp. loessense TaxID=158890 RepID=A0A1G4U010_9HYPH|nr:hypothetical protein SAMN02927900_05795 [Rhizobium mongolense subsp. loessense]
MVEALAALRKRFNGSALTKSSLDHLPEKKQRELARVVEIIHEEFENALKGGEAEFKKKGRIWKVILFGSMAAAPGSMNRIR